MTPQEIKTFFAYEHLPQPLQMISRPFATLVFEHIMKLPDCGQRDVALQKALEAKDAAVRSFLDIPRSSEEDETFPDEFAPVEDDEDEEDPALEHQYEQDRAEMDRILGSENDGGHAAELGLIKKGNPGDGVNQCAFLADEDAKARADAIDNLCRTAHQRSVSAGWYSDQDGNRIKRNFGEMLALIHSEVSEALEAERCEKDVSEKLLPFCPTRGFTVDKPVFVFTGLEEELADLVIRVADLAGYRKLRLGEAIEAKMTYNLTRADHKIENRAAQGGKKF